MKEFKFIVLFGVLLTSIVSNAQTYHMPAEDLEHEGTWLQWPHNNLYGPYYQDDVESTWIGMTSALQSGENVHIIAYDQTHKQHIQNVLSAASVPLENIDFHIYPTNDVWVRDNGPIFVYDEQNDLKILDWGFNGWGNDTPYDLCDVIPASVSNAIGMDRLDLNAMVLEGGAIEHDGRGTMIATRSSVTHASRNPNLTESEIEQYLTQYMGFSNFIWLDGVYGQDITDQHIDGFLRFANDSTIVTMNQADLLYWNVSQPEIDQIQNATNVDGDPFIIVELPLTQNNAITAYGNDLGYKGSYCNFYTGNEVVLMPIYNDPNDDVAKTILQSIHPNHTVVGVNVQNLYEYGGMLHCVTQQQPVAIETNRLNEHEQNSSLQVYPNPCTDQVIIENKEGTIQEVFIMDVLGNKSSLKVETAGDLIYLDVSKFDPGVYFLECGTAEKRKNTMSINIQ